MKERLKGLVTTDLYIALIIILVGTASFGLGKLSAVGVAHTPIDIEYASTTTATSSAEGETGYQSESQPAAAIAAGGKVVASKTGDKYHFPWCSGAQRINEANKVWFDSAEEARKAGYEPAANCKGLE